MKMKRKQELRLAALLAFGLALIMAVNATVLSKDENRKLAKAVFYVA